MPPTLRNPCSHLPRRLQIVASLTGLILFCILFLGSSSTEESYLGHVPYGPKIEQGAHQVVDHLPKLPKDLPHVDTPQWLNPWRTPAHSPPPEQADSRAGDARWFSDFKWRNPFSSSVTLDEERAVLPPLKERPPVYTYFDTGKRKDEKRKKAERELLEIWRRAWWAQGFTPVVLSNAEATSNPLYKRVQHLNLKADLEAEMMRWLAWHNMKAGILSNWLAVPMAHYDDALLSFLRKGEYPALTRYQDLENGLFVGSNGAVEEALNAALGSPGLEEVSSITALIPQDLFKIDPDHDGIAFYSTSTIAENYVPIKHKLENDDTRSDGLAMLPSLINSHLHQTWQNWFSSGIAVLKPIAQNTTGLIEPAIDIATNLSQCANSPIPASCPPNRPNCKPCVSSTPVRVITPPVFRNTSTLFTIATVPHPYTLQSLIHSKRDMDMKFIRRNTTRDTWILATTKELLGTGISSFARLANLKDAVASEYGSARSLWLTAEDPLHVSNEKDLEDLNWFFGFQIAGPRLKTGKSETPVPGPERRPPPPKQEFDGPAPDEEKLRQQRMLVENAKPLVKGTPKELMRKRDVIEAWNLADTEAWKFVRAFGARRGVERRKFEEGEAKYLGRGSYDRWKDYVKGG
ncbi:hypothetical protein LTR37_008280 [Vermiconidia calcicola]|uniref:Uncharacterized protein n=1 Tax=Vermiconidia calcicola TaxID=1690605 RepID=A0ACC3NB92_9PEZI|nr:hypothetical protein LTR37_008280 [Vermiconidia calcicola]